MADDTDIRFEDLDLENHSDPEHLHEETYHGQPTQTPRAAPMDREAREQIQRAELAGLQQVNQLLSAVNTTIAKAEANMETVSQGVTNANNLLDLWIRILSQTEHNQRLLQSESWHGLTKDLADVEEEERQRKEEVERRVEDARRRAAEREKEAAAAEARRVAAEKKPVRGIRKGVTPSSRGRGRGGGGGGGIPAPGPSSGRGGTVGRGSGIARGAGTARGRGKGVTK
ncbi:hypothetical protein EX30DRAFT_394346 [Ascodesmis nigricans]|uniref:DASH complex subunit DUO1 n=1 Tax=Ascodesmis nigricans TaxID=341454 RepID=A0A4S2N220_9PEZI|nr:hypothetical protein EX30DRAFT_394346 [Ascodesmis nigricans]